MYRDNHYTSLRRVLGRAMALSLSAVFFVLIHGFAQSLMTTYVGPQLPANGSIAAAQSIDHPTAAVPDGAGGLYIASYRQSRVYFVAPDGTLSVAAGTSSWGFGGDGGPATDAMLASPTGLAIDAAGNLYILDAFNFRVRKVTKNGVITTIAGTGVNGFSGDGGPAVSAQLSSLNAIAVDPAGDIYISDGNRIREITPDGTINTIIGGGTIPAATGVPAASASVSFPAGIAVDGNRNIYIVSGGGVLFRIGPDGIMTQLAMHNGTYPFREGFVCTPSGDGGPASSANVCNPNGLALDSTGNLYLTDGNLVRRITTDGVINTFAGGGSTVLFPFNIAVDGTGNLYIAEAVQDRVRKVGPDGSIISISNSVKGFAGDGGPAARAKLSLDGSFFGLVGGIALDHAGNLYIADNGNNRVRQVTSDGVITTLAGSGVTGLNNGDGGPAISAGLQSPRDVFVDNDNNVYILNDQYVRKVTPDGVIHTVAGCGAVCNPSDGLALDTLISSPHAIAVDAAGELFIAQQDRVWVVDPTGRISTILASGNSGIETGFRFWGLVLDPAGGFYVSGGQGISGFGRIYKITAEGTVKIVAGNGNCALGPPGAGDGGPAIDATLCAPSGMALDSAGNLYVSDYEIRKISPSGIITTVAGAPAAGFGGDGAAATSAQLMTDPTYGSIAVDSTGNLYIADTGNSRVRKVIPAVSTHTFNLGTSSGDDATMVEDINTVAAGYGTVQPAAGSPTPAGIEVFSYRPSGVLISETAVPASHLRQSGRIYAESTGPVRTGIAIANPGDQNAVVSFYFTDSTGMNFGSGTTTIPAHDQFAAFLDQAPYRGSAAAQSFTFTASVPVAAIALRAFVNERSEALLTTLPVAAVSSTPFDVPSGDNTILPHFAAGGGWSTQVLLVNPTDGPLSGIVEMDGTYPYTIAPRSSAKVITSNWKDLRTGNVRVTAAAGTALPVISTVFSMVINGITVTQTGIATTGVAQSFDVYVEFDSARQLQTGIAIGNVTSSAASIRFDLLTLDGVSTGHPGSAVTDPAGHLAMFLNQIPGLESLPPSFRGVLRISSDSMISAIGLRTIYNERGDFLFATTPAVAGNTPPPSDAVVFPQIVSGSGFNTEIILMNSAGTSQGTVTLTSQSGIEMPLFAH